MNKKNKMLILGLLSTVTLAPMTSLALPSLKLATVTAQTTGTQSWLSLGASLNSQEATQTKALLGATNVDETHTVLVDGNTINQYLKDGSNNTATVYSSAYIEPQASGYGVQVQIVTPNNITLVTPTTYQNAAITSGAKDVLIKIATVSPVTGEGALAGVYALLAKAGVQVDSKAAQVAQKEIQVVSQVKQATQLSDLQVNQLVSDMKKEITTLISTGKTLDQASMTELVKRVVQAKGYQLDDNMIKVLVEMGMDFATTDAAKSKDTITQLQTSVDNQLNANWSDVLTNIDQVRTPEEIKTLVEAAKYDDISIYHPIIPALYNALSKLMADNSSALELYSHTFIVEDMLADITAQEHQALNQLRVYIYEYMVAFQKNQPAQVDSPDLKTTWLAQLKWQEQHDATLNQIIKLVALASGYAPEAYTYSDIMQEGSVITFLIKSDEGTHLATAANLSFDVLTGAITDLFGQTILQKGQVYSYDFNSRYGVSLENGYQATVAIPNDYTIPGYTAPESTDQTGNQSDENVTSQAEDTTLEADQTVSEETTAAE